MGRPTFALIEPLRGWVRPDGVALWWTLLGAAALLFGLGQIALNSVNGYWIDEYFSTWISDPARGFGPEFFGVIARDTNPPLYFTLLRLVRGVIAEPRVAYVTLDLICVGGVAGFVAWTALRNNVPRLGVAALAAFVLSGPAMMQFPEGRTYFLALCVTFSAAWAAGLVLVKGGSRALIISLVVLGVLAALTHVFAALFAGCLGAGLAAQALLARRRDLFLAALALGGAATLAFGLWFLTAPFTLNSVSWIEFSYRHVTQHLWTLRRLVLGPLFMILPLLALMGFGLRVVQARPVAAMFGVTIVLFLLLPIAISFKTPIITGRYWSVGGPAVVMMLVLLARAFLLSEGRWMRPAAGVAVGTLVLASLFGFQAARENTAGKPVYEGADMVADLARDCGPGAINAASMPLPPFAMSNFMPGFAMASGLPDDRFADADAPGAANRQVIPTDCPIVGWHTHLMDEAMMAGPDAALIAKLRLESPPGLLSVVRFRRSYVVLNTARAQGGAGK